MVPDAAVGGDGHRRQRRGLVQQQDDDGEQHRREQSPAGAGRPAPADDRLGRRIGRRILSAGRVAGGHVDCTSSSRNTSFAGAFSTDASRPPATASGRPIIAGVVRGSPPTTAMTATSPPASEASGVTIERFPVTRPRSRQASAAASHSPPATAKAAARHSAEPLGGPYSSSAAGTQDDQPTPMAQAHGRPHGHGAHDLDHEEVVQHVAHRGTQSEDDGQHGRTLLDDAPTCTQMGAPGLQAGRPHRHSRRSVAQKSVPHTVRSAKLRGARSLCFSAIVSASASSRA